MGLLTKFSYRKSLNDENLKNREKNATTVLDVT